MEAIFYDGKEVRFRHHWLHAKGYGRSGTAAVTFARNYAKKNGRSVVWNCDDSALIFERSDDDGKVRQRTLAAGSVRWTWPGKDGLRMAV